MHEEHSDTIRFDYSYSYGALTSYSYSFHPFSATLHDKYGSHGGYRSTCKINYRKVLALCTVADTCLVLFFLELETRCEYKAVLTFATYFKYNQLCV